MLLKGFCCHCSRGFSSWDNVSLNQMYLSSLSPKEFKTTSEFSWDIAIIIETNYIYHLVPIGNLRFSTIFLESSQPILHLVLEPPISKSSQKYAQVKLDHFASNQGEHEKYLLKQQGFWSPPPISLKSTASFVGQFLPEFDPQSGPSRPPSLCRCWLIECRSHKTSLPP